MLESNPSDARLKIADPQVCQTLKERMGTGGNNVPLVLALTERISYGFEPGAAKRLNPEGRFYEELVPTLRQNAGDNQAGVVVIEDEDTDREKVL